MIARTSAAFDNRPKSFHFYLGDSHATLWMTMWAIDFAAAPFEQCLAALRLAFRLRISTFRLQSAGLTKLVAVWMRIKHNHRDEEQERAALSATLIY